MTDSRPSGEHALWDAHLRRIAVQGALLATFRPQIEACAREVRDLLRSVVE